MLLLAGADPNVQDESGNTLLITAAYNGDTALTWAARIYRNS